MRQTATATEKVDPLIRIQEEIKEVERREREYRKLISTASTLGVGENEVLSDKAGLDDQHNDSLQSLSPVPPVVNSLAASEDGHSNMPSLALSVNSIKDDDHHSDDSGISASSSPVNGVSANIKKLNEASKLTLNTSGTPVPAKEHRYIGPNCYNLTPEPPQQKLMTRTVSTPMLSAIKPPARQFTINPAHKGVMQRFIASRGKMQLTGSNTNGYGPLGGGKIYLNGKNAATVLGLSGGPSSPNTPPNTPMTPSAAAVQSVKGQPEFVNGQPLVVDRSTEGRALRPGYVPVELKIQRELQDLKSRESELKKIRKIRQSTSDLLDAIENEMADSDDEDSDVEHCFGPGKMRAAKSIGDMCDTQNNNLRSVSPIPDYERNGSHHGMRPAMSLAQLCDLDPEEAPSSRGLIAQWENRIQQNTA